jgi:hypothetical protein
MTVHELLGKLDFSTKYDSVKIIILRLGDVVYDSEISNVSVLCRLLNSEVLEFNDHIVQNFQFSKYTRRIMDIRVCAKIP